MKSINTVIGICLALLLGIAAFDFLMPQPRSEITNAAKRKQLQQIADETRDAKKELGEDTAFASSQLWTESEAEIGPAVLSEVTAAATAQALNLKSFRPQRTMPENRLERFPFLVNVEGPFTNILNFVANLEAPGTRLGVTLVQCSALDGDQTTVAASVAIVAVRDREAKPAVVKKQPIKPEAKPAPTKGEKKDA